MPLGQAVTRNREGERRELTLCSSHAHKRTHTHEHAHTVEGGYVVEKVKDLPRLHRSVWKGNLVKVKRLTKSMKNSELNSVDKEKR